MGIILIIVSTAFGLLGSLIDWHSSINGEYWGRRETNKIGIITDKYGHMKETLNLVLSLVVHTAPFLLYVFVSEDRDFIPLFIVVWQCIIGLPRLIRGLKNYSIFREIEALRRIELRKIRDARTNNLPIIVNNPTVRRNNRQMSTRFVFWSDLPVDEAIAQIQRRILALSTYSEQEWQDRRLHDHIQETVV